MPSENFCDDWLDHDWAEDYYGVEFAHAQDKFRFVDRKGHMCAIRKRQSSLSGSWCMCAWCGLPVYQTQSKRQRCCSHACRWALYYREKRDERLTGEELEDRVITLALSPMRELLEIPAGLLVTSPARPPESQG